LFLFDTHGLCFRIKYLSEVATPGSEAGLAVSGLAEGWQAEAISVQTGWFIIAVSNVPVDSQASMLTRI
jgi:hypothetical protein